MNFSDTAISGVKIVESSPHIDERGAFSRLFCERELAAIMGNRRIVQINHSRTATIGAVRGMHYQSQPHAEMKLVRCMRGQVWDVAVDLRRNSPTFLRWHAEHLSEDNMRMMVIPEGCAHGFQVLSPDSELLYLHTTCYAPWAEGGIRHDDPMLSINWPQSVTDISARDKEHPLLTTDFHGIDT